MKMSICHFLSMNLTLNRMGTIYSGRASHNLNKNEKVVLAWTENMIPFAFSFSDKKRMKIIKQSDIYSWMIINSNNSKRDCLIHVRRENNYRRKYIWCLEPDLK